MEDFSLNETQEIYNDDFKQENLEEETTGETCQEETQDVADAGKAYLNYFNNLEQLGKKFQNDLQGCQFNFESLENKQNDVSFIQNMAGSMLNNIMKKQEQKQEESTNYEQMIIDVTRKWEKLIVESGEWKTLMEENPTKKLSDLIFEKAEEYGQDELSTLKKFKKEQDKEKSAEMFKNIFSTFGNMVQNMSNTSSVQVEEVVEVEPIEEQEVAPTEDLQVNVNGVD